MKEDGGSDQASRPKHPFRQIAVESYESELATTIPSMMPHLQPLPALAAAALVLIAVVLWLA
jgi:hypothetical protein